MVDHVGIYGSKGAEGLSAFNAGLVRFVLWWVARTFSTQMDGHVSLKTYLWEVNVVLDNCFMQLSNRCYPLLIQVCEATKYSDISIQAANVENSNWRLLRNTLHLRIWMAISVLKTPVKAVFAVNRDLCINSGQGVLYYGGFAQLDIIITGAEMLINISWRLKGVLTL